MMSWRRWVISGLFLFVFFMTSSVQGEPVKIKLSTIEYQVASRYQPIILQGMQLTLLENAPISNIAVFANNGTEIKVIPFQIDKKDKENLYILDQASPSDLFDENDECVFYSSDLGKRITNIIDAFEDVISVAEITVKNRGTSEYRWAYVVLKSDNSKFEISNVDYIRYDAKDDHIQSDNYRIGFSTELPFLLNELRWRNHENNRWSSSFVKTMTVKHEGKLFGVFYFERTVDDYTSKMIGYKDGPIRIIRRTANKIRIFSFLKTPSLIIDYIAYKDVFFLNLVLDIPFKIGLFFDDVVTDVFLDWNPDKSLPESYVFSEKQHEGALIDGSMTEGEIVLNSSGDKEFVVYNQFFTMATSIDIGADLKEIEHVVHMDDSEKNRYVGFHTINWEKINTEIHHMLFNTYLIHNVSVQDGLRIARGLLSAN